MTGYLERMAARAVSGSGSAVPRLPSRFEPPAADLAEPAAWTGDADVAPATEERHRSDPGPMRLASPAPVTSPTVVGTPDRGNGVDLPLPPLPSSPVRPPPRVLVDGRTHISAGPSPAAVADQPPGSHADAGPDPGPNPGPAARVTAVPLPERGAPAAHGRDMGRTAPSGASEQVVRISIGRVEVRATVAPPAALPAPVPAPSDVPESLSLQDYLTGRRESR